MLQLFFGCFAQTVVDHAVHIAGAALIQILFGNFAITVVAAELNCPYELVFDNGLRPDELVSWTEKEKVNEELQCK